MAGLIAERSAHPGTLHECHDCGLVQRVAPLRPGQVAECERCGALLRRRRRNSLSTAYALSVTGLMLMLVACIEPMMAFRFAGQTRETTVPGVPIGFETHGMPLMAVLVFATTTLAPLLRFGVTIALLGGLRSFPRGTLVLLARLRTVLRPWAMTEVFLLGLFVAYTRMAAKAAVIVGPGTWALGALMLVTAWSDAMLDEQGLWTVIGRRGRAAAVAPGADHGALIGCRSCGMVSRGRKGLGCPRCDTPLRPRKKEAVVRTWALVLTSAVLYVPANTYPILTLKNLGYGAPSTIIGGVQELIEYRMWPLALIVFVASILVPVLKLVGLTLLLVMQQRGSAHRLVDRTRLYRIVDFIGRWSMIDVFMLSILTALVQMGVLAEVTPGPGAQAFAAVVVLTMLAAMSFDPRMMWDVAEVRQAEPERGARTAQA